MLFLILNLFAISLKCFAFINIESLRQEQKPGLSGSSALQLSGQSGNTEKFTGSASNLLLNLYERDEILFLANYVYGSSSHVQDTNNGQVHLRYTFMVKERHAIEVFTQAEFDQFKSLNSRTLAGADLRERLLKNEAISLFLGVGAFFEIEDYSAGIHRENMRGSNYLTVAYHIGERFDVSSTFYYQPLLKAFSDFRTRLQADLDYQVGKQTSLNLTYVTSHDSWVPPGRQKSDVAYLTGLKIKY